MWFETNAIEKLLSIRDCIAEANWVQLEKTTNQLVYVYIVDSTGIRIYYSPILRKYELGNVQIGQSDIEIPASSVRNEVSGGCSNYCTSKLFTKPFYLTRTYIHMHTLGKKAFPNNPF